MVAVNSTMVALGTDAPEFTLPSATGGEVSLSDFKDASALVVMFICNHCPFVKHIRNALVELPRRYSSRGVAFVGINANDWSTYEDDSPQKMAEEASRYGYEFHYLYDESQEVAKTYRAACTPDFFVYDAEKRLVYRGQLDSSRPGNDIPVTGKDLAAALDAILAGQPAPAEQRASIGCNIKWRAGNEPDYFQ